MRIYLSDIESRLARRLGASVCRSALLTGVASLSAIAAPAVAQETPAVAAAEASASSDPDIVVTALKRSISVQDTPVTVNLVSGEAIAEANIVSALDLPAITPGVIIQVSPAGFPIAAMRGIGSNPSNQSFDQSVAMFVNGVFAPRGRDYASSLFDIADIQVIKGGQSAVLGKNTTIGALALTTRRPEKKFGFEGSYAHEFELGSNMMDAAINIPLSDSFAVRAAGRVATQEGWLHNELLDTDTPVSKSRAGRISVRWQPAEALDWDLSYQKETYKIHGQVLYVGGDALGVMARLAAIAGDPNFTAAVNDRYRATPRAGFGDDLTTNNTERAVSNLNYSFGDGYALTALTGYLHSTGGFSTNFNAMINGPIYFFSDRTGGTTWSQEVRLTTPQIGIFELLLGGLYYHDDYGMNFGTDAVAPTPITGAEVTTFDQTTESWSGFGTVTAHVTDSLTFNGALRYTTEDRSADYTRQILRGGALVAALFRPFAPTTLSRSSNNLDGSASVQYRFSPAAMAYASFGRGTKSGGFANNPNDPNARRADGTRAAEFDDEVAKTIEVGAKFGRASGNYLNLALYRIDLDGHQVSLFSGVNFIVNNVDARSQGVELDGAFRLSDALRLSLNATYADAVNKHPATTQRARLPRAPTWSGIASVSYAQDLMNGWRLSADGNAEFRTKLYFTDERSSPAPASGGYVKFGLRLGVNDPDSGLGFALIGRNLTDKRIVNFATGAFPGVPGAFVASTDMPRTIALQVTYRQ